MSVPGNDLRTRVGLRSTWVSVGVLSLSGPPQAVLYGQRARLSGVARGLGSAVVQEWKGSAWQPLGALAASTSGSVSVVVRPTATTQYRLATGKVAAPPVRVPVASLVRFYPTRTQDELRGYVRPGALGGARVAIQRQQGSGWATVAGATVDAAGNFVARLQLAGGVYRARVSPGRGFVAGTSPVLRVSTP